MNITAAQDSRALKPCPFCGGEPRTTERPDNRDGTQFFYAVACYCGGYSATAHKMAVRDTPEQAKHDACTAWNRRAALSAEPAAVPHGLLEAAQQAHDWMDSQADSQSKGNHHSFDLFCLRQERDALAKAIAAAPQPAAQERKPLWPYQRDTIKAEAWRETRDGGYWDANAIIDGTERAHGITGEPK